MAEYLDKFQGLIGKRQANQLIKLLNKKKNAGQIRTVDEFTQRLEDLIRELTTTILQPTLRILPAQAGSVISAERHNYMLDRVQDDLEAAFEEANKIDEVQQAHEAIVRDVLLKNLRAGIAEIEGKLDLYESLGTSTRGFSRAIFSTFRESKLERTSRNTTNQTLFMDPKTNKTIDQKYDAYVDPIGERLTLATNERITYTISNIRQIFDSEAKQSDKIVENPSTKLSHIIDGQKGTYWIQSIYFPELTSNVKVKLELDLGITKDINFLEVEPITDQGIYLESIYYKNSDGVLTQLSAPDLFFEGPIGVQIKSVTTRYIVLVFRNENYKFSSFQYVKNDTLFNQAVTNQQSIPSQNLGLSNISSIANDLNNIIPSSQAKTFLGITAETPQVYTGYYFTTGFDNIRLGVIRYEDTGIYVSTPLELTGESTLGLKTHERRPIISATTGLIEFTETTYDGNNDDNYLGSVEYWLVKRDYSSSDTLLKTTRFAILPLGTNRIHHERLLLTEKSNEASPVNDIGQTAFYTVCDDDGGGDGNVVVYRNGIELANVDNLVVASEGWRQASPITSTAMKTPDNTEPMRFRIQIVGFSDGDIYTVSYTPMVSSTPVRIDPPYSAFTQIGGLQVVDLIGDLSIRRNEGHIILVEASQEENTVDRTEFHLLIILRRNSAYLSLSPAVEDYTLMGNLQKVGKYEEL